MERITLRVYAEELVYILNLLSLDKKVDDIVVGKSADVGLIIISYEYLKHKDGDGKYVNEDYPMTGEE